MNWQECNVVRLNTKDNCAPIDYNQIDNKLSFGELPQFTKYNPQHLYITNPNEGIKEGDWMLNLIGSLEKEHTFELIKAKYDYAGEGNLWQEKIIATTDESLDLARPSNEFLKKFCELGGIDKMMIEYEHYCDCGYFPIVYNNPPQVISKYGYDGHICSGKYRVKVAPDNAITIKPIRDGWNREEVKDLIKKYSRDIHRIHHSPDMNDWIKENI